MKFFIAISVLFCLSCTHGSYDHQTIIDEIYNAKVQNLRYQKLNDCKEKQIQKANEKVDSIVHQLLNADLLDTVSFPAKPIKPPTPKHIIGTVKKFEIGK